MQYVLPSILFMLLVILCCFAVLCCALTWPFVQQTAAAAKGCQEGSSCLASTELLLALMRLLQGLPQGLRGRAQGAASHTTKVPEIF